MAKEIKGSLYNILYHISLIASITYSPMPQTEEGREAKRENVTDRELNTPGIGQQKQQRTGSGPGSRVQCTKAHL